MNYLDTNWGSLDSPVASEKLIDSGFQPLYPNNHKFAVLLSHDIDSFYYPYQGDYMNLKRLLKHGYWSDVSKLFGSGRKKLEWIDTKTTDLLDFLEEFKITSTFFFLALQKGDYDFSYRVHEITDYIFKVIKDGHEIGLHGGHLAYKDKSFMKREFERLENVVGEVSSYRNHYLKFTYPDTLVNASQLGFSSDATIGDSGKVGFPGGWCHPLEIDLNDNESIVEIPLNMMDQTLFNKKYMGLQEDEAIHLLIDNLKKVREFSGVYSILIHNYHFDDRTQKIMKETARFVDQNNGVFLTHKSLVDYWHQTGTFKQMRQLLNHE